MDLADDAMRRWITGAATGDWSRLLAVIDPDVTFHVPVAGFEGVQRGVDAARRFFDRIAATIRAEPDRRRVVRRRARVPPSRSPWWEPSRASRSGNGCALCFDIRDGRVARFREYPRVARRTAHGLEPHDHV
jgi:ketosteroid isomerase-like protein